MEKLCQFAIILSEDWLIVMAPPFAPIVAEPETTCPPVGSASCARAGETSTVEDSSAARVLAAAPPSIRVPAASLFLRRPALPPPEPRAHSGTTIRRPRLFDQICL